MKQLLHILFIGMLAACANQPQKKSEILEAHRILLNGSQIGELHRQFSNEDVDPAWSHDVEGKLRSFLAQTAPSPEFDVSQVECRSSLCEVHALGYEDQSWQRWQAQVENGLSTEAWDAYFSGQSGAAITEPGHLAVVLLLHRKEWQ